MCRAKHDGGRRCKCNFGSHRRAAQRARYAVKVASAQSATIERLRAEDLLSDVEFETTDLSYAAHTYAEPVYRDPTKTRIEVGEALLTLRESISYHEWPGSGQLKAYVSAAITHGAVLRDNTLHATEQSWAEHGVSDADLSKLMERKRAHHATKVEVQKEIDVLISQEEKLKEDNADWLHRPELLSQIRDIGQEWATLHDEWNNQLVAINKEIFAINDKRRELYIAEVKHVLAGERSLGGEPLLSSRTRMTRADTDMFNDVVSFFPSGMLTFANARDIPLRPMRSKKRAHYGGRVTQKTKVARAGVLNANHALSESPFWSENQDYVSLDEGGLRDRHVPHRETVEDTPENRAALEKVIANWKSSQRKKRINKGATPTVVPVTYAGGEGAPPERRLALYIPEAYTEMSARQSAPVGELTFNDRASIAHEFGHHIEYSNPEVAFACKEFLKRRTDGFERILYLKGKGRGRNKTPDEIVTPDGFVDSYIGKHYEDTHHTEVFSMGVEALFAGQHGGLLGIDVDTSVLEKEGVKRRYRSDPEHFALIMGLLATANGKAATG